MGRPRAVVCLSGGLDSTVCVAIAAQEYEVCALHLQYGQRTMARELQAFEAVCGHYGIRERLVAQQPAIGAMGGSSLTDPGASLPSESEEGVVPSTYVPFRNAQILALATGWGEVLKAETLFLGAVQADSSGYPDCREEFLSAFERAMQLGTRPGDAPKLRTPLLHLGKDEIVKRGLELGAPLELSWSCYQGQIEACGQCESCQLRLNGFARAGAVDPLPYSD